MGAHDEALSRMCELARDRGVDHAMDVLAEVERRGTRGL
jgi:hypothetical protein